MDFWTFAAVFGMGALAASVTTSIAWAVVWRRSLPPQRVTAADVRVITDRVSAIARYLRATHSKSISEVESIAAALVNLERQARGTPPLALPSISDWQRELYKVERGDPRAFDLTKPTLGYPPYDGPPIVMWAPRDPGYHPSTHPPIRETAQNEPRGLTGGNDGLAD